MNSREHAIMSSNVREYFQRLDNNNKVLALQVADIATMTDKEFVMEKLESAEERWNDSYSSQDYSSQDHKEVELDTCKYSFDFWKKVADLKGCV